MALDLILKGIDTVKDTPFLINTASTPAFFYYSSYDEYGNLTFSTRSLDSAAHSRAPFISKNKKVFVASRYGSGNFEVSNDGGVTWSSVYISEGGNWQAADGSDDGQYLFIAGFGEGMYSKDFGQTFISADGVIEPGFNGHSCFINNDGSLTVVIDILTGKIFRNDNYLDESSWVYTGYDTASDWAGNLGYGNIWGSDDGKYMVFYTNYKTYIHYSIDYGLTWTQYVVDPSIYYSSLFSPTYTKNGVSSDGQRWFLPCRNNAAGQYFNLLYYSDDGLQTINNVYTGGSLHIGFHANKELTKFFILENTVLKSTTDFSIYTTMYTFPSAPAYSSLQMTEDEKYITVVISNNIWYSTDYGQSFSNILSTTGGTWYTAIIR